MLDFAAYFDDSGTHNASPIAIAACYIARKSQWDWFVRNWDRVAEAEGFAYFHMADFAAKPERGCKPYCDWNDEKRERVYCKLVSIIKTRAEVGFAIAVPKQAFDDEIPEVVKERHGQNHYTFAVRCLMGRIAEWRQRHAYTRPMQYVFDLMSKGKGEIDVIWRQELSDPPEGQDWLQMYGMTEDGYSFQSKKLFKPLQAADVLAWQMYNHMSNVILLGKRDVEEMHPHFRALRTPTGAVHYLGFFHRHNLKWSVENAKADPRWIKLLQGKQK